MGSLKIVTGDTTSREPDEYRPIDSHDTYVFWLGRNRLIPIVEDEVADLRDGREERRHEMNPYERRDVSRASCPKLIPATLLPLTDGNLLPRPVCDLLTSRSALLVLPSLVAFPTTSLADLASTNRETRPA